MVGRRRSGFLALIAAGLLIMVAAGSASAASSKSFSATFCYAAVYGDISPALVATVTWSGYRVDGIAIGEGDGTGAGFGGVTPIAPARSGTETVALLADDGSPFGGVDIRLGNHVWQTQDVTALNGSWANLPAC